MLKGSKVFLCVSILLLNIFAMCGMAGAANVRHVILNQQDWANNLGVILEFNNDQTKDDAIAQFKTMNIAFGLANGKAWRWANGNTKWEANKVYSVKAIVQPDYMELQIDGKKRGSSKGNFAMFDSKPQVNGVPEWSTGQAAYGIFINSLKVTTSDRNDFEVTFDKADYDARMVPKTPDWQLSEDDKSFTVEFTFSIIPEE